VPEESGEVREKTARCFFFFQFEDNNKESELTTRFAMIGTPLCKIDLHQMQALFFTVIFTNRK
jgi:hypothetical protein